MADSKRLKIRTAMSFAIGALIGTFITTSIIKVISYISNKDRYMAYSAPWYTSILVTAFLCTVGIGICLMVDIVTLKYLSIRAKALLILEMLCLEGLLTSCFMVYVSGSIIALFMVAVSTSLAIFNLYFINKQMSADIQLYRKTHNNIIDITHILEQRSKETES